MRSQSLVLVALTVASCASPSREVAREEPVATATPPISPEVRSTLEAAAVTNESFARRVFYSWASDAGVARMLAEKRLILPTEREGYFGQLIDRLAASGSGPHAEMARLLATHPSLSARRYAWTRPFPTRVPLANVSYGDHLVRAVLKPEAIIGLFDAREQVPFRFVDLDGNEVPLGRVLADPSTLAAIYHVAVHPESSVPFREYVLCNEAMVAEWSVGTEEIARVLEQDLAAMRELEKTGVPPELADVYAAALAFDTPRHRPTRENLHAISLLLEDAVREPAPVVVAPTVKFARLAPEPPPVPPLPRVTVKPKKYECI